MTTSDSSNETLNNYDGRHFRRVRVLIYTTSGIFSGFTLCQPQQRLLDALNKGFHTSKLQTSPDFLPLFEVNYSQNNNSNLHMDTAYVRKNSILFVGEQNDVTPESPTHMHPLRRKKPLQATINLPHIVLTGNMHSEMWEEMQDALNHTDQFIPLTDVDFDPPLESGIDRLSFVAINKDHIIYVGK